LADAPNKEAVVTVHNMAHGMLPSQVIEVDWRAVEGFLGRIHEPERGEAWECMSFRTMLCTEVDDASGLTQTMGSRALDVIRQHDELAAATVGSRAGLEVRRTNSGMVGCFPSVVAALESALALQQSFGPIALMYQQIPVQVRMGLAAGEPIFMRAGLFEAALDEASAICNLARPGEILVSGMVRDLCMDKGFLFAERGETAVKGLDQPVRVYSLEARVETPLLTPTGEAPLPDGLSRREVEVLRLISMGKTNQEIANSLVISLSTVNTHVRNILEKTDSANRAEAACYALRKRLA
jgi:DNA-binding CsgD family transcriptional regulator